MSRYFRVLRCNQFATANFPVLGRKSLRDSRKLENSFRHILIGKNDDLSYLHVICFLLKIARSHFEDHISPPGFPERVHKLFPIQLHPTEPTLAVDPLCV